MQDKIPEAIQALLDRTDTMITASDLAPAVRMHPAVIIKYAKDGTWPREVCNYVISGERVKFFREDFLRKAGYLADEPVQSEADRIQMVIDELKQIRQIIIDMMERQK